jgi:hypothetical protein
MKLISQSLSRLFLGVIFTGVAVLAPIDAKALTFTLNDVFNGDSPTSSAPWLTAEFATLSVGTVKLTLTSNLNVESEFFSDVAFNVNPIFLPSSINIVQNPVANPAAKSFSHSTYDGQNVQGGGDLGKGFDIRIDWTTANNQGGVGRFNNSDVVYFLISANGLTADDINFVNTGGANAHIAAHVQGIPGDRSGAI